MSETNNSVRIQAERIADYILEGMDNSNPDREAMRGRVITKATERLNQMAILLVECGYPDIRDDEQNWTVIAELVDVDPKSRVEDIFNVAYQRARLERAAKTTKLVERLVERLRRKPISDAFLEGGDWYVELAKRNIRDSAIYWRFLERACGELSRIIDRDIGIAVLEWQKSGESRRVETWPKLWALVMNWSIRTPWQERYKLEYESLPRLTTVPEDKRGSEYERREAIRHELLSMPAPKENGLSPADRIKEEMKIQFGTRCLNRLFFPDQQRLRDWIDAGFDQETIPDFADAEFNRLAKDLQLALVRESDNVSASIVHPTPTKTALNTKERRQQLVKTGQGLISKKKYHSKSALAKAMKCDLRSVVFKAVWKLHEEKHGPKTSKPKVVDARVDVPARVDTAEEELDRLIDEQQKDKASETIFRNGKRVGNRRNV